MAVEGRALGTATMTSPISGVHVIGLRIVIAADFDVERLMADDMRWRAFSPARFRSSNSGGSTKQPVLLTERTRQQLLDALGEGAP